MSKSIQIIRYPDAVLNQPTGLYQIPLEGAAPLCTPAMTTVPPFGSDADLICNEAIYVYKCADGMGELEQMSVVDPYLGARLFSLIASHADICEISVKLNGADGFAALRTGSGPIILAHWICGQETIGVCANWDLLADKEKQDAANKSPRRVIPSDLLYALSIVAQQTAIGSTGFLIRWDYATTEPTDNTGRVVVAFNDLDLPDTYFGTRFLMGGKTAV